MASKLDPNDWMPTVPNLEVKEVNFSVIKRAAQEALSKELIRNLSIDVSDIDGFLYDHVIIRLAQRMMAKTADETVITDTEEVPANWWSHLIVAIVGGISVPKGYGWRWKLLKRAKFRAVITRTTFYRVCPHVHIPEDQHHLRWLLNVNDDASQAYWQRGQK